MNKKTLLIATIALFSANAFSAAMPATRAEARWVASHIDQNIVAKGMSCSSKTDETSRSNCAYGYSALALDDAMQAAGYSYRDTLHKIAKDQSIMGYMSAGLSEFVMPINMLTNADGQAFMLKNKLVYKNDIPELKNIITGKRSPDVSQIEGLRHQPSASELNH
ncbi:hypothetical protein [Citrobacter freundii]